MAKKGTYSEKREIGCLTDPYLFEGYAWYAKDITLEEEDLQGEIVLYLERTRMTKVWVNDVLVGEADSLNTPHQYNLTKYITEKNFHLTILVSNVDYPTKGGHLTSPDTQTNWNGIIGEIALHIYEPVYISGIRVFTDIEKKEATLELTTVNTTDTEKTLPLHISAELMDIHGTTGKNAPEAEVSVTFKVGTAKTKVTYALGEDAVLWSEYSPVIYQLTVAISETKEKAVTTFGLRKFSTNKTEFLINGTTTFLRGKHDGLIFPLTGAVPTTVEEWIRVMKISKSYEINHYRFHAHRMQPLLQQIYWESIWNHNFRFGEPLPHRRMKITTKQNSNIYELYVYPQDNMQDLSVPTIGEGEHQVCLTKDFYEAKELLAQGKHVLYLPEEVAESLEGFYCTDFWCYPMFRDICNWMKKPVAVGTMGLLIQKDHPAYGMHHAIK